MLSSFVDSVEVDGVSNWAYPCGIFTKYSVGVEGKQPSLLIPP